MTCHRFASACVALVSTFLALDRAHAQTRVWDLVGNRGADQLGASLSHVPDVDGDGVVDLIVGAPGDVVTPTVIGKAVLYSGASGALLREFDGDAIGDGFGNLVADLGDVDGDGVRDYAFAAPLRDVPGLPIGAVFVYSGAGPLIRTFTGQASHGVGNAMSFVGDVDGDGVRDLIYSDTSAATVYVTSGATGAVIRSHTGSPNTFGVALGRTGDADADGIDDYAIFDNAAGQKVWVHSGATGSSLYSIAAKAQLIVSAGDVDLDGHADFALSNPGSGSVPVISGATGATLYTLTGDSSFGTAISATGDLDGDGHTDLIVTRLVDPSNPYDSGYDAFAWSGATGKLLNSYSLFGSSGPLALDATADVNGDGVPDFISGNRFKGAWSYGGTGGYVLIDSGTNGGYIRSILGRTYASIQGAGLAVVSDSDGDGYRDVAVTVPGGLDTSGASFVQIVSGRDGHELSRVQPTHAISSFGGYNNKLTSVGDVNGDSVDDVAVIAYADAYGYKSIVEVRSGADGSLLTTIQPPTGTPLGLGAAIGLQGERRLAVTTVVQGSSGGQVSYIHDLPTGVVVASYGACGAGGEISCVGDVDNDGVVDWVVGDSAITFGAVHVFSGAGTNQTIWTRQGTSTDPVQMTRGVGDLDGDGQDDVLYRNATGSLYVGSVAAISGRDGSLLFDLKGTTNFEDFGSQFGTLGDVNGDGSSDFFVVADGNGGIHPGAAYLYSGATAALLYRIDGDTDAAFLGATSWNDRWHDEARVDPDAIPDLAFGDAYFDSYKGRAQLFRLDDLYLEIDPSDPAPSQKVTLTTSGGPGGSVAGLFAVDLSGIPIDRFVLFGTLDASGILTLSGSTPPGLSGNTLTLRAYAIGFSGKLVDSQDMTITFQ